MFCLGIIARSVNFSNGVVFKEECYFWYITSETYFCDIKDVDNAFHIQRQRSAKFIFVFISTKIQKLRAKPLTSGLASHFGSEF